MQSCPRLQFAGLMTIGRYDPVPNDDCFKVSWHCCCCSHHMRLVRINAGSWYISQVLLRCRDEVCDTLKLEPQHLDLSMGMSHDFEMAVCALHACMHVL